MLIEIVQHEANKVIKEATLEQAIEYAHNFPVNLVDPEGNRTPFVPGDHVPAEQPADDAQPESQAEATAEDAPAAAAKKAAPKKAA